MSLPSREAWIEILNYNQVGLRRPGRFPRGKRGLKFVNDDYWGDEEKSLPSREAWIEIIASILLLR